MVGKILARMRSPQFLKRVAIAYLFLCTALYFQQQRLMFFPSRDLANNPARYQLKYEDLHIPVTEGQNLHGWWIPGEKPDAPVMLYFHHNAINIGANVSQALQFHNMGYTVVLFDYRGFGQSDGGFPTEAQVYEDARAMWNYVTQVRQVLPSRIVIYGHSVGGAIAIDLAAQHPEAGALIVQSSFTSMRDMTKRFGVYWVLPIELILRQRFESLQKMKSVGMPVLVITGTEDVQIPVLMGERLSAEARGSKQLIIIPGGGHDNHLAQQYRLMVKQFINAHIVASSSGQKVN